MSSGPAPQDKAAFEAAHAQVCRLVDAYEKNRNYYVSQTYQETEARTDFIDKFWMALGWDVHHERQLNPYEQEVKVERNAGDEESRGRRADYAFLAPNFRDVRFFVEAKRPGRDIDNAADYFQVI